MSDETQLNRYAKFLIVQARACTQNGYASAWQTIYGARVVEITLRHGAASNSARIEFPDLRWQQQVTGLNHGVNIRILTNDKTPTVVFMGFLTNYITGFSGGDGRLAGDTGSAESNAVLCMDYRWLYNATSAVYGVYARSRDDYDNFATAPTPKNSATFFSGRRCIFNFGSKPNRDSVPVTVTLAGDEIQIPIFSADVYGDPQPWTCGQMIQCLLNPYFNKIFSLLPITDVTALPGMDHADFARVINGVECDTPGVVDGVNIVLRHMGFSMREQYTLSGPQWVFFKSTEAAGYTRSSSRLTILHDLHAPAVDELITDAVEDGKKMLIAGTFEEDITAVINAPVGLGAPHRFEFTAELVPGWMDTDLVPPDSANDYEDVYLSESDLQLTSDPNGYDFYKYYHTAGSSFRRNVGRKWVLNEAGDYSASGTYDRGMPFDWASVLAPDDAYSLGRRKHGLFRHTLLSCLSFDAESLSSLGILVEMSLDGGTTWFVPHLSAANLSGECGIRIEDPNLSEILDPAAGTISGGDLDGFERNYWTGLCDDRLNSRVFKTGGWQTRLRVTASVQLDQRLLYGSAPTAQSGSPFAQTRVYDFSDRYTYQRRTESSELYGSGLPAWATDESAKIAAHLDALRDANQDMSVNGQFTLDRLWLGDGSGEEEFRIGDAVASITGRDYDLSAAVDQTAVYPEIIQIIYDVQHQVQHLVTRDLRMANMRR